MFWYRYDTAADRKSAAETAELIRQLAAKKSEQRTDVPAESNPLITEKPTVGAMVETATSTEAAPMTYKVGDIYVGETPPPLPISQDELVSPYGFGPYPELPDGFGPITWPRRSAESELLIRVRIKLLKQGVPVEGSVMSNGLVYPIIKGIRYVTWGQTSDGRRYLRRSRGHPDDGDYLRTIANEKEEQGETLTQADVPHIILIPMEEGGIDPIPFLIYPNKENFYETFCDLHLDYCDTRVHPHGALG